MRRIETRLKTPMFCYSLRKIESKKFASKTNNFELNFNQYVFNTLLTTKFMNIISG